MAETNLSGYFPFINKYSNLLEVLSDRDLASLGDAYINFAYSLALSKVAGKPVGRKMNGYILSSALKKSGIRAMLPHRLSRHQQADAAEALMAYGWLSGAISIRETVDMLAREGELIDNVSALLRLTLERCRRLMA